MTQTLGFITYDELVEALKTVRLWVRHGDNENVAWRMKVLHPEDVANDLFISAETRVRVAEARHTS